MTGAGTRRQLALHLSRRALLRLGASLGATAALAACGASPSPTARPANTTTTASSAAIQSTTAGSSTASSAQASSARQSSSSQTTRAATPGAGATPATAGTPAGIAIPTTGATLPTGDVHFHWIDSAQAKTTFLTAYAKAYHQAHPNITVDFEYLPPTEAEKVVPLGVQNGNAPDLFQIPLNVTVAQVVTQGWIAPLDDVVPNFATWKAAFPPGSFSEGITTFKGKTYTFPLLSGKFYSTLILYNTDYMQQAGYDPAAKPLTWDDFRAAAKKLTDQGKGQYYGLVLGGKQIDSWQQFVSNLGAMAGAAGGDINWQTGAYNYTSDAYLAAIDLLLALKADNSVFPGSLGFSIPDARARAPQGVAGMILHHSANIPIWSAQNPQFHFDIASQPLPNAGTPLPLGYTADFPAPWGLYAKSQYKAIAGDMFAYLGSEAGQSAFQVVSGGGLPVTFPKANQAADLDPRTKRAFALYDQQMRLQPDPLVRNPDIAQVLLEQRAIKPNFGETVQGIYTGQLKDAKAAMKDLQDRAEAELQRAIKAAQGKGAKVSRDDWKFPNWDPLKDYTDADYKGL
jgi:multiple sugar transport system substrate-binding protein